MAYIDPHQSDPIRQCFNSQLPPTQATSGDCGLTYSSPFMGEYVIDFGFQVGDRFVTVMPLLDGGLIGANLDCDFCSSNHQWGIRIFYTSSGDPTAARFFIVVY